MLICCTTPRLVLLLHWTSCSRARHEIPAPGRVRVDLRHLSRTSRLTCGLIQHHLWLVTVYLVRHRPGRCRQTPALARRVLNTPTAAQEETRVSRIAWNRHPDDVEPVVAILLASRYAGAKRIRPSRGDRGIDVLAPSTEPGMVDVYQVKRFAENLNASQKSQIEHSLEVIGETAAARGVRVGNWYLTLPLDPTPENLDWLAAISSNYEFQCDWRGLSFIDSLAAEFPAVIVYYLRDGRDRLEHAMADLARIIHG